MTIDLCGKKLQTLCEYANVYANIHIEENGDFTATSTFIVPALGYIKVEASPSGMINVYQQMGNGDRHLFYVADVELHGSTTELQKDIRGLVYAWIRDCFQPHLHKGPRGSMTTEYQEAKDQT